MQQPRIFNVNDPEQVLEFTGNHNSSGAISGNILLYTDPSQKKIQDEISRTAKLQVLSTINEDSTYSNSCNQYGIFKTQKCTENDSQIPSIISTTSTTNNSTSVSQIENPSSQIRRYLSQNIDLPQNLAAFDEDDLYSTQIFESTIFQTEQEPQSQIFTQQQQSMQFK